MHDFTTNFQKIFQFTMKIPDDFNGKFIKDDVSAILLILLLILIIFCYLNFVIKVTLINIIPV